MTGVELTRALEQGKIDNAGFRHVHHLHVAWTYLRETSSVDAATARMGATLRSFATAAGVPEKFHQTITDFWVRILFALHRSDPARKLEGWMKDLPQLLAKDLPLVYYSRERLFSDTARQFYVEPDLKPLPTTGNEICSSRPSRDTSDRHLSGRSSEQSRYAG